MRVKPPGTTRYHPRHTSEESEAMSKWDGKGGATATGSMITTRYVMCGMTILVTPVFFAAMLVMLNPVGVVIALAAVGVMWSACNTSLKDELRSLLVAQAVLLALIGLIFFAMLTHRI